MEVKGKGEGAETKGAPARASVKNHPRGGASVEGPFVKYAPPWSVRGGHGPSLRFKNHPGERK